MIYTLYGTRLTACTGHYLQRVRFTACIYNVYDLQAIQPSPSFLYCAKQDGLRTVINNAAKMTLSWQGQIGCFWISPFSDSTKLQELEEEDIDDDG